LGAGCARGHYTPARSPGAGRRPGGGVAGPVWHGARACRWIHSQGGKELG
jgi:hypothetical protein